MPRSKKDSPTTDTDTRRVIKKYPNRRLYDSTASSYITLNEVKKMVLDGVGFVVQDAKTGADISRSILLQIILEEETAGVPLFSEDTLSNIIRFYGHALQSQMGKLLESNLQNMSSLQRKIAEHSLPFGADAWRNLVMSPNPFMQSLNDYANQMLAEVTRHKT